MQNDLVFKSGIAKKAIGLLVFLGSATAFTAMAYIIYTHPENQTSSELLSGAILGIILAGLMVGGLGVLRMHWRIEGENIIYQGVLRKKVIPFSTLAGFGQTVIIVALFSLRQVDLYDSQLKPIARLPLRNSDWSKAETALAQRLRYVANEGSAAFPKRKFVDTLP
jgi:hypothetical protein